MAAKKPNKGNEKTDKKFVEWTDYVGRERALQMMSEFTQEEDRMIEYVDILREKSDAKGRSILKMNDVVELCKESMKEMILNNFQEFMDFVTERTLDDLTK